MLPLQASLLGEALTGVGILGQLNIETGIPIAEAEPLLLAFIAFNLIGVVGGLGDRGRFVDDDTPSKPENVYSIRAGLGLNESGELPRAYCLHDFNLDLTCFPILNGICA